MIVHGYAVFNEVMLIYFNNIMQLTAVAWLVYNVFNELLVICRIKMWTIKPKPDEGASATAVPYDAPEATYKEMSVMGGESNTDMSQSQRSVDGV